MSQKVLFLHVRACNCATNYFDPRCHHHLEGCRFPGCLDDSYIHTRGPLPQSGLRKDTP